MISQILPRIHLSVSKSSFHKKSTRNFLLKLIQDDWGFPDSEVVAEMRFDIPKSYDFHKSKSKDVEVDLIRIFVANRNEIDGAKDCDQGDENGKIYDTDKMREQDTRIERELQSEEH